MNIPLFEPFAIRGLTIPNRLALSPMCQYSAVDGMLNDWHFANLSRFAIGGFGLVMTEACSVNLRGRLTHGDLGIWQDEQVEPLKRLVAFLKSQGAVPAIQLGHAGRKASSQRPWEGNAPLTEDGPEPAWKTVAPSALPAGKNWPTPEAMSQDDMAKLLEDWVAATKRANAAGFELLEVHAAHGYLLNSFLSPLSNQRNDEFGGNLDGRMKFPLQVIEAVRSAWPAEKPLSVRISAVDGMKGGWSIDDSVIFAARLKRLGVDLIDCSTGGIGGQTAPVRIPRHFGFQVPFAEQVREQAEIATIAVGLVVEPEMANEIIAEGRADIVALGREALVQPNWPHMARRKLSGEPDWDEWPPQVGWWLERRDASLAYSGQPRR